MHGSRLASGSDYVTAAQGETLNEQIKKRVVGAAVLLSLAVIFIPMLLDGDGPVEGDGKEREVVPQQPEIRFEPVDIPNQAPTAVTEQPQVIDRSASVKEPPMPATPDEPMPISPEPIAPASRFAGSESKSVTVAGESSAKPAKAAPAQKPAAPAQKPAAPAGDVVAAKPAAKPAPAAPAAKPVPVAKPVTPPAKPAETTVAAAKPAAPVTKPAEPTPAAKAAPAPEKPVAPAPVPSAPPAQAASATPPPAPAAAATPPPATPKGQAWVIQVGSFTNSANAMALRDKLRGQGYAAFVERLPGASGPSFRVRIGPESDRTKAEQQQKKLGEGIVVHYP